MSEKMVIEKIIEGIQDKKGKGIIVADLSSISEAVCDYFVICNGESPSQITAIVNSVRDVVIESVGLKPFAIDGLNNAEWVALDYADIWVHIFLPEARAHYDLEHLWADAKLTAIPDLD